MERKPGKGRGERVARGDMGRDGKREKGTGTGNGNRQGNER